MRVNDSILDLVGRTPLVRFRTGIPEGGPKAYVKLEFQNPSGSIKDRMALHVISEAMEKGTIKTGDTVVDNSSGNTGASVGMIAASLGLKAIIVTPDKTSQEKVDLIRSYGTEVIVTPTEVAHDDPEGCYMVARKIARDNGYFDIDQYNSQDNVEAHYRFTGPEIWEDTEGQITHFVCGIGTGGTFSGTARFLKEKNPKIRTIAVDPEGSIFSDYIREDRLIEGHVYKVEGIGSDVITEAFHRDYVDEVITVTDRDSFLRARLVARNEGICGGGSSGSVAYAMAIVADELKPGDFMVGIFADSGIRYMSKCFNDEWMKAQGFLEEESSV